MFVGVYYVRLTLWLSECVCVSVSQCVYVSSSAWCGVDVEMKATMAHRGAGSRAGLEVWQTERGGAGMQRDQTDPTSSGYLKMS